MEPTDIISDELRAWIGNEVGPLPLPEEVAASDVRRFLAAIEDDNPIWRDPEAARAAGYPACPVPGMLVLELFRRAEGAEGAGDGNIWPDLPFPPGFRNGRNAGNEFEYLSPVYVGDRLSLTHRLVDIVAKQTRMEGVVIFSTRETDFIRQTGEVAVRLRATTVRLRERTLEQGV
jgi:acyl dehydratase